MTRTLQVIARATRITQPIRIITPRDPSIRCLGFETFRLRRSGGQMFAIPHVDRRNTMASFVRPAD